jgi:hypothetical protein
LGGLYRTLTCKRFYKRFYTIALRRCVTRGKSANAPPISVSACFFDAADCVVSGHGLSVLGYPASRTTPARRQHRVPCVCAWMACAVRRQLLLEVFSSWPSGWYALTHELSNTYNHIYTTHSIISGGCHAPDLELNTIDMICEPGA